MSDQTEDDRRHSVLRGRRMNVLSSLPAPKTRQEADSFIEATAFYLATVYMGTEGIPFATSDIEHVANKLLDVLDNFKQGRVK